MKEYMDIIRWFSIVVIAGYIEYKIVAKGYNYANTHCSYNELPKDLQK